MCEYKYLNLVLTSNLEFTLSRYQYDCFYKGECSKLRNFDLSRISCNSLQILIADNCPNLKRLMHLEFCKELI